MSLTAQTPKRRALLIGIDDYTASTLPRSANVKEHRGWPDLKGAANDVEILREMLIRVHGFKPGEIVTLKNQQATRAAILRNLDEHLVRPAAKGDILFYYFAGHGSRVPNDQSDEPDRLDESIVPADSRLGALDIRDKELRPRFNEILARGAHLTLLLDHCHSGSGFRGSARPRGIAPAPKIADSRNYGQRPEERGALVLASTQDLDEAWETRGEDGLMHGTFTWAWIRAMRDAAPDEPAQETFLRAQARLRAETPFQAPVMLGNADARRRPFLGARVDRRRGNRAVIAVERVEPDGTIVLQGGWANGLYVGSVLHAEGARLRITAMLGLSRSIARAESGSARPGMLVETAPPRVEAWLTLEAPPGTHPPYRLALRNEKTQELVRDGRVIGGEIYTVVLQRPAPTARRYYYAFVIDSAGRSQLLYPPHGSVENRFPTGDPGPAEIPLGEPSAFKVVKPYGRDTYILLSSEEPLPIAAVLEWDGVRAAPWTQRTTQWSIERLIIESVPRESRRPRR